MDEYFFTHFSRRLKWAFLIKFYPFYVVVVVVIVAGIVVIFSHFHLLQTTEPISTKLGTMHPLVKKIQVCSNEEPCLISKGSCSSPEKCLLTYRRATVPHIVKTVNILRTKSCARFGLNFSIFLLCQVKIPDEKNTRHVYLLEKYINEPLVHFY